RRLCGRGRTVRVVGLVRLADLGLKRHRVEPDQATVGRRTALQIPGAHDAADAVLQTTVEKCSGRAAEVAIREGVRADPPSFGPGLRSHCCSLMAPQRTWLAHSTSICGLVPRRYYDTADRVSSSVFAGPGSRQAGLRTGVLIASASEPDLCCPPR